ncbi:cuticle protein CP14.6-like [Pollicipes pollicipes]|uniref:cuticle protein CP14.6-like n=1 Tax=Pollicipes pollicipes TaxID=41117 RepID=UPI0018857A62|nr:cuticle protein CP14.6-like [Pollicipes pollicipes]
MAAPALQMLPLLLLSLTVPPASPAALVNKQRQSPADTQSTSEADARIINYQGESYQDGYHFQFETTNGIKREEVGKIYSGPNNETGVLATEGRVHWTAPDGMRIEMHWHADENGFQPRGVHMRSNHWHPVPELPPQVKRLKKLLGPQKTKAERLRLSRQRLIERVRKLAPGTSEQEKTAERASF